LPIAVRSTFATTYKLTSKWNPSLGAGPVGTGDHAFDGARRDCGENAAPQ